MTGWHVMENRDLKSYDSHILVNIKSSFHFKVFIYKCPSHKFQVGFVLKVAMNYSNIFTSLCPWVTLTLAWTRYTPHLHKIG